MVFTLSLRSWLDCDKHAFRSIWGSIVEGHDAGGIEVALRGHVGKLRVEIR